MPDEDKNFGESLVLDFRKWWRRVQAKNLGWNIHSFSLTSHRRLILGLYFFVNANDFLSSINNASVFLVEWVIFNYWNLRLISSIQSSSGPGVKGCDLRILISLHEEVNGTCCCCCCWNFLFGIGRVWTIDWYGYFPFLALGGFAGYASHSCWKRSLVGVTYPCPARPKL